MRPDQRRLIPRTDALLDDPAFAAAVDRHGRDAVKRAIRTSQDQARAGMIGPAQVPEAALARLDELSAPGAHTTLRPILNATGVVIHTNLARAPLSAAAREALAAAAGYTDLELDLAEGTRGGRGRGTIAALLESVPAAPAAHVVNNGAAALFLATAALAGGRELLVSRGEVVEIGDGFRLLDLVAAGGVDIVEVGTTNRTMLADYADALTERTGAILKVHPSNFRITGFAASVPVRELVPLGVPVIADIGSGLLAPDPDLPHEPDATTALTAGAALVTCSGDKLLGGPQSGLLLGRADLVQRCRRHPLARAVRADKLTLAALEATLRGPRPPAHRFLHADPAALEARARALAQRLAADGARVVPTHGEVGGGGAPGVSLPGWAVALPPAYAAPLRLGDPSVVGRLHRGSCLLDLRCVEPADDGAIEAAVRAAGAALRA